jgi:hypothetical protein
MRSVALLALIVFTASGAAGCLADAPDDPAGERSDVSESALSTVRPEQPVTKAVSIKLRMTSSEGNLERLYLPVIKNGTLEHIIVDSGTSRTWFRLAGATQTWLAGRPFAASMSCWGKTAFSAVDCYSYSTDGYRAERDISVAECLRQCIRSLRAAARSEHRNCILRISSIHACPLGSESAR